MFLRNKKLWISWVASQVVFQATFATSALAGVVIIPSQDEVKLPIDLESGSLVQMPFSVKTITPTHNFEISDVGSQMEAATGAKTDVRLFMVRPVPGAKSENVTFILGNGKAVKTRLVPAADADKHYDLVFPNDSSKHRDPRFLQPEVALMRAMLRDEAGDFARQVADKSVKFNNIDGVSARLTRIFAAQELVGYSYELRNRSSEPVKISISSLSMGNPNRAVLLQVDKDTLQPCRVFSTPECKTTLRIVSRGDVNDPSKLSFGSASSDSKVPFMKNNSTPQNQGLVP